MSPRLAILVAAAAAGLGVLPAAATAQVQQHVYPQQGQSAAQQQSDETACSDWARQQSGWDPANPPNAEQANAAPVTGSGARMRGAATGAMLGAVGGSAATGAAAGAAAGGVARHAQNSNAARNANAVAAQQTSDLQASYARARSACLQGRGYSVK